MAIQYSVVATSNALLLEANIGSGSAKYVRATRKILKKVSRGELRRPDGMATLLSGSYAYNYIHGCEPDDRIPSLESLVFLCVTEALPYTATPSDTRESAFTFLTSIRRSFLEQFRGDLDVLCKERGNSGPSAMSTDDGTSADGGGGGGSGGSLIHIDGQMKQDLRRFSSFMKDQMISFAEDPHALDDTGIHSKSSTSKFPRGNGYQNESKTSSPHTAMDMGGSFDGMEDMRQPPPPSGHPTYHPSSGSKINKIISQIEETKSKLKDNINQVVSRGEEISLLHQKAVNVDEHSASFRSRARRTQYVYCRNLYQQRAVMALIAVIILYLISAMLCGWTWDACGK